MLASPHHTALPAPSREWDQYNSLLVERGDLAQFYPTLHTGFKSLNDENTKDPQHPKAYPDVLFEILCFDRETTHKPWRQVQGVARALCEPFGYPVPHYSTIYLRCKGLTLEQLLGAGTDGDDGIHSPAEEDAIDSTGLKLSDAGEYLHQKYKPTERKIWLRFHTVCNTFNHKIRAFKLTPSAVKDSQECLPLLGAALAKKPVTKLFGDSGYDSFEIFDGCDKSHVMAVIKPRKNARSRSRGHGPSRGRTVWQIHTLGLKAWKEAMQYGHRWTVEQVYSSFKRLFGEYVKGHLWERIEDEVRRKVQIFNYFMTRLNE